METSEYRGRFSGVGAERAVLTLTPLTLLLTEQKMFSGFITPLIVSGSLLFSLLFVFTVVRSAGAGKTAGAVGLVLAYAAAFPLIDKSPFYTLTANTVFIYLFFLIISIRYSTGKDIHKVLLQRAKWALNTVTASLFMVLIFGLHQSTYSSAVVFCCFTLGHSAAFEWAFKTGERRGLLLFTTVFFCGLLMLFSGSEFVFLALLVLNMVSSLFFLFHRKSRENSEQWWDVLLSHPARILFSTFFILCMAGTFLLLIPVSTVSGNIDFIDAVFTSVSAVCVTGLIVLDTPNDFTFVGQFIIMILIQLGGLGIMSITTIALQSLGRRLSLKHETVMVSMTETDHKNLTASLSTILKYTFITEAVGFVLLTALFKSSGDSMPDALWRGLFTSVSAFCNAGFALQSDSLAAYSGAPAVLTAVAVLIFLGGMAPAIAYAFPIWIKGGKVPLTARIALVTTSVLVLAGTLFYLVFEWNASLYGQSVSDKLFNAFFQSVTLRTAGFNSVEISGVSASAYIMMIIFMFIGGSPGGTAGGIKTTTVGVLMLTFWANITSRSEVTVRKVMISQTVINKSVTIVISGFIIWLISVSMMEVTQQIPSRDLIFEVTSAIGTVGLSTGATAMLDPIGKVIIIITMFAGRIGPMTLFTFMSSRSRSSGTEYTESSVTLT